MRVKNRTNATSAVHGRTPPEPIHILHQIIRIHRSGRHLRLEQHRLMYTLPTRKNLLPAHENIERVRQLLEQYHIHVSKLSRTVYDGTRVVLRVGHGIERSCRERELVY